MITDFSGLSAFTYTQTGNNTFDVRMSAPAGGTSGTATLRLATQGSGTNFIRANSILIGAAAGSSAGTAWGGVLGLGKANTLNATNFNIGGFNGSGSVSFQAGITNGTLLLRGTGGGANPVTTITIGETSSGTRDGSGSLDLTGGTVDLLATTMLVGRHGANGSTPAGSGTFTMAAGTATIATLVLGEKSNTTGTPSITGVFTQNAGSVTSGTIRFGNILASSSATAPTFTSIYNLAGGTLRAGLVTTEPSVAITATTTSNSASVRRIAWSGGTIANYDASTDLTISGTNTNAGYTMQLVLGSTTSPQVFSADSGRTITIGANAVISGTGLLQKQGDGTLRINTAATYTGSTGINGGTVQLGVANGLPATTGLSMAPSAGTATLDLNGFNQTLASLSSSGAGTAIVDVAATGTSMLTVGGDNTSTTFAGTLRNSGGATSVLGLTKNGTGTLTLTGSNNALAGNLVFNTGKVTIDPGSTGSFTSTGRFQVLPGGGVTTTVEILSGSNSFTTAAGIGGLADNSTTGTAVWSIAGGTTTLALTTNRFLIGNKGTGNLTVSNGAFTATGTQDLIVGGDGSFAANNATGVITVSGGTLSITGAGNLILGRNQSAGGTTTGANGTINLDGGVFATARPFTMAASGSGSGTLNFNGGTLRALASSANFIAVTTANVNNGGAVVDTNSFNLTVAQPLLNGGTGGLTKTGAGTLTLGGASTYTGPTLINAGTLALGAAGSIGSSPLIRVDNSATYDVSAVANYSLQSGQTLKGHGTVVGDMIAGAGSTIAPGGSTGLLTETGVVTLASSGTFQFEINDVTGIAGSTSLGWDLFDVGSLLVTASSAAPYRVNLVSLGADQLPGPALNWDDTVSYAWKFIDAGSAITTFATDRFLLDPSGFQNTTTGGFLIARGDDAVVTALVPAANSTELYIVYAAVPEPRTAALAGIGLAVGAWLVRRRRTRTAG